MTAANRNRPLVEISILSGAEVERALRAGMVPGGRPAAAILQSLGDRKKGHAAYLRITKIALPAMLDARSMVFHADDAWGFQWWRPAFFDAIGNYQLMAGAQFSVDAFLAYVAEVVAKATRPPATILQFPITRRLEQTLGGRHDHNSFPEGPSAA
jgi:hypothetical protein